MVQVTIEQAPAQWPQLLEAIDRGEAVYVGDAQRRVRLVVEPALNDEATPQQRSRGFGCMKGQIWMSPDFDEPDFDMTEYGP
jgi:antitoxin (DNA-binding transcriptional repressor) of toxin-antitoxin stability system